MAHFQGQTYHFTDGTCSGVLDENQFVYTTGDQVNTFFISVLDLNGKQVARGGTYRAALLYRVDGKDVFNPENATLRVSPDLSHGAFRGKDYFTHDEVTGSYSC